MLLFVLAYLGGVLTILSPCILPVLPFVFARADRSFARSGLPLLAGMALAFAAFATLAAVGGGWAVKASSYGRWLALALMALFGLALLLPGLADRLARPFVAAGNRVASAADGAGGPSVLSSFVLGAATGLLWAPCAGPILGLVLTGAALQGASAHTTLLLLAYGAGAATSLALALLAGGRLLAGMKRGLGAGVWVRRALGAAVLAGTGAILMGWDTGVLARLSAPGTTRLEDALIGGLAPGQAMRPPDAPAGGPAMMSRSGAPAAGPAMMSGADVPGPGGAAALPVVGPMPPLDGAVQWLNSPPLSAQDLRGKVVLVDFWTYSCINCLRALPYVRAWAEKYRDQGLVVIGVHTPEFAFEKDLGNVGKAVRDLGIDYPVAVDNDYAIWRAFSNRYWPAHYFVDAQGRVRYRHFGEGEYDVSENVIRQLLAEAGRRDLPGGPLRVEARGAQMPSDFARVGSPETYLGYRRAERFASPGGLARDAARAYAPGPRLALNEWTLAGDWTVTGEYARLERAGGRIAYRFRARDVHLVLGPGPDGRPLRFRVRVDGAPPGTDHGSDIDADGLGTVDGQRLYQLVRQADPMRERTFEIEFLEPGAQAYAFTFG